MKLTNLMDALCLEVRSARNKLANRVTGGYVSDLLSDVIANSNEGDLWVTLQVHVNIVAVACMKDLAGIVLVNGREPQDPVEAPPGAQRAGDLVNIVDGHWWCNGADLGPATESWKQGAAHETFTFEELADEYKGTDPEMAAKMTLHAWYCPVTGYRIDGNIVRDQELAVARTEFTEQVPLRVKDKDTPAVLLPNIDVAQRG